eukprot:scaffold47409_cov78-Phaeocystis_antarctica.AAC.1
MAGLAEVHAEIARRAVGHAQRQPLHLRLLQRLLARHRRRRRWPHEASGAHTPRGSCGAATGLTTAWGVSAVKASSSCSSKRSMTWSSTAGGDPQNR